MPDTVPILRCANDMADGHGDVGSESSDSDVVSWVSENEGRSAGLPACAFRTPAADQTTPDWHGVGGDDRGAGGSSSGAPPRAKGAKYTRPTRHFPRQACQLCDEPRVFETRSSFSEHLKIHKYVWVKGTYCIPLQQAMGHMRGRVGPRRRPQCFSRGCGASPPRKTPPRGSLRSVPPPTFVQWKKGGAGRIADQARCTVDGYSSSHGSTRVAITTSASSGSHYERTGFYAFSGA